MWEERSALQGLSPKLTEELFDSLMHKVVAEKCEISIEIRPDGQDITIRPWEPFKYNCPYKE